MCVCSEGSALFHIMLNVKTQVSLLLLVLLCVFVSKTVHYSDTLDFLENFQSRKHVTFKINIHDALWNDCFCKHIFQNIKYSKIKTSPFIFLLRNTWNVRLFSHVYLPGVLSAILE